MISRLKRHINQPESIAPLITFRVLFGLMMVVSIVRFILNGWVDELYIKPSYHFTYYGFEWVMPMGSSGMWVIFSLMLLAAFGIMFGAFYRTAAIIFFLTFTYVELIDKTNYLNHYYFVSLVSLLLIVVPANRIFSIDARRGAVSTRAKVPAWCINIFKLQLGIVYCYAGLAKLTPEWLFEAMPLRIWLPAHTNLPLIGTLLDDAWVAYTFSWAGASFDLFIVLFLLKSGTRPWAYLILVVFHVTTWILFPIGMFPFIMIGATIIFFSPDFHERILKILQKDLDFSRAHQPVETSSFLIAALSLCFVIQLLMPFRYLAYPGNLFWTEQGYRFSWRVMLMEKAGAVVYHVKDKSTGRVFDVMPSDYLTANQVKMMATQPDMTLQFAHYLQEQCRAKNMNNIEVRAEAFVTLNGSGSRLFIDPEVNLLEKRDDFRHKDWILPFSL
jgi:hypothetical protein